MKIIVPKGHQIECSIVERPRDSRNYVYPCSEVRVNKDKTVDEIRQINGGKAFEYIISSGNSGNGFDVGNQGPVTIAIFGERTCEIKDNGRLLDCD